MLQVMLVLGLMYLPACKKLVEIPAPAAAIVAADVYSNDASAAAALTGIYTLMSGDDQGPGGIFSSYLFAGLSADELTLYDKTNLGYLMYYRNALDFSNPVYPDSFNTWPDGFTLIYNANAAIEGLSAATSLTPAIKQQLLGEAYFIRAYCYFYMVNLYGDVPLVTTTDYKVNSLVARAPQQQVWQLIISDLKNAEGMLSSNFVGGDAQTVTMERTRPTKWAATALLARTYLYQKDYPNAITCSSTVIANSSLFSLNMLDEVFLKNSTETIWSLQPIRYTPGLATGEGTLFNLPPGGPTLLIGGNYFPVYLSDNVVVAFESGDQRKTSWVNQVTVGTSTYNYAYKYKAGVAATALTEYAVQFRLAEQYLIRAEAEASINPGDAVNDLNVIRTRAGLPGYTGATDAASLETAILHERQVELFTEGGHRWFDLKRTGTVNAVMSIATQQKGGTWRPSAQLFPIALSQLQVDPNLKQTPGY